MQVVEPYSGPTPPAGVHRYVVSLFLQPGSSRIDVSCLSYILLRVVYQTLQSGNLMHSIES